MCVEGREGGGVRELTRKKLEEGEKREGKKEGDKFKEGENDRK